MLFWVQCCPGPEVRSSTFATRLPFLNRPTQTLAHAPVAVGEVYLVQKCIHDPSIKYTSRKPKLMHQQQWQTF